MMPVPLATGNIYHLTAVAAVLPAADGAAARGSVMTVPLDTGYDSHLTAMAAGVDTALRWYRRIRQRVGRPQGDP